MKKEDRDIWLIIEVGPHLELLETNFAIPETACAGVN